MAYPVCTPIERRLTIPDFQYMTRLIQQETKAGTSAADEFLTVVNIYQWFGSLSPCSAAFGAAIEHCGVPGGVGQLQSELCAPLESS